MNFISALETKINLQELENCIGQAVVEDKFIQEICTPLIGGGKRLRPLLFLTCSCANKNFSPTKEIPLAAALELIHTASLVHDDILDNAKKRRGVETINSMHGSQIAVLVGDYLFAKAFQLVAENDYGSEVSAVLSKLVKNLCLGEIIQDRSFFVVPTLEEYYTRINLKTAFFLSTCCRLGGIIAKLERTEIENLADYGSNLGLAFQIIDDLLDFFGEEKLTGKAVGGDLKSGVITLPIIRALEVSPRADALTKIIAQEKISCADVALAIEIIRETDAVEYCRTCAENHIAAAKNNLPEAIDATINLTLKQVADFVISRNR